jgi:hypothetical protein
VPTLLSRESSPWMTPAPSSELRYPPPLIVRPMVGRLVVLKFPLIFFSHVARAASTFGLRLDTHELSDGERESAGRTRGPAGHVAETGA